MKRYKAHYFVLSNRKIPARDFIDSLDITTQRKFFYKIELLEQFGNKLTEPHAKYLGDDIYELRLEGTDGAIRALYFFFVGNKIIFTNMFKKKTQKLPKKEIELAKQRKSSYMEKR
ncbi:MAG: type II toxin-antitoxin system RelE/ParE family toxin [Candidatus Omnitrophica bacterium]|nr:type II toxin-antitoxin system RelE/ParE family toxin [Candidatus Omnitrophota bacterium]